MRFRTLIPLAGLYAFVLLGASAAAMAQSASFAVSQNGKPVGTASFTFTPTSTGIDSTSLIRVDMQGLNYSLSKSEELSPANGLLHVQLSAIVNNAAVNIVAKPDGAQFLMNISANGRANTTRLDAHRSTVFLPDFDPGALQTLLTVAAASNNRDLWAILPKQAGSSSPLIPTSKARSTASRSSCTISSPPLPTLRPISSPILKMSFSRSNSPSRVSR